MHSCLYCISHSFPHWWRGRVAHLLVPPVWRFCLATRCHGGFPVLWLVERRGLRDSHSNCIFFFFPDIKKKQSIRNMLRNWHGFITHTHTLSLLYLCYNNREREWWNTHINTETEILGRRKGENECETNTRPPL